jgi:hypothetical protein
VEVDGNGWCGLGGGEEREREDLREVVDARAWVIMNESRLGFVDLDAFIKRVTLPKHSIKIIKYYHKRKTNAQNLPITHNSPHILLHLSKRLQPLSPPLHSTDIPAQSLVCALEGRDDGEEDGGCGWGGGGGVGGESGMGCGRGVVEEGGEELGVVFFSCEEVGEEARVGWAVHHRWLQRRRRRRRSTSWR